jgi:hypothetical protein
MFRKTLTAAIAVAALLLSSLALNASANPTCPYDKAQYPGQCEAAQPYPGPFGGGAMPAGPSGPYGFTGTDILSGADVQAAAPATADGTGGGTAPLAVTGSESTVLGYVGTGLIAFGAVAMGSRRKFFQSALD